MMNALEEQTKQNQLMIEELQFRNEFIMNQIILIRSEIDKLRAKRQSLYDFLAHSYGEYNENILKKMKEQVKKE